MHLREFCNGKVVCPPYVIDYTVIGDPARNCAKEYTAKWRCVGAPGTRTATVAKEAGFKKAIELSCSDAGG
jgi:hypothetical protein